MQAEQAGPHPPHGNPSQRRGTPPARPRRNLRQVGSRLVSSILGTRPPEGLDLAGLHKVGPRAGRLPTPLSSRHPPRGARPQPSRARRQESAAPNPEGRTAPAARRCPIFALAHGTPPSKRERKTSVQARKNRADNYKMTLQAAPRGGRGRQSQ